MRKEQVSMRFSKSVFTSVILAASILFAVMISGGCRGSSNNIVSIDDNTEGGDSNGPDYYTSEVAEKLIARSDVHDLAGYVKDTSITIKKGEVLLYYPVNGEDIKTYGNYWPRLSEALEKGAIISVVDIEAGEIDEITSKLSLNVPSYLPDNATEEEKAKLVDFLRICIKGRRSRLSGLSGCELLHVLRDRPLQCPQHGYARLFGR